MSAKFAAVKAASSIKTGFAELWIRSRAEIGSGVRSLGSSDPEPTNSPEAETDSSIEQSAMFQIDSPVEFVANCHA
jgi:hypothetical protein